MHMLKLEHGNSLPPARANSNPCIVNKVWQQNIKERSSYCIRVLQSSAIHELEEMDAYEVQYPRKSQGAMVYPCACEPIKARGDASRSALLQRKVENRDSWYQWHASMGLGCRKGLRWIYGSAKTDSRSQA